MKAVRTGTIPDPRHIADGREIPTESYSDQPYIVQTDDGAWLCCVTTGAGHEGDGGQHVISLRSTDQGRTWSAPVDVEPASGPEASYAVLLKVPSAAASSAGGSGTGRNGSCTDNRSPVTDHRLVPSPATFPLHLPPSTIHRLRHR